MPFQHTWNNNEANFGPPVINEENGGAHVSFEILPTYRGEYLLGRRPRGVQGHVLPPSATSKPAGLLYLCYDLIRWGESTGQCISRIVEEQLKVNVVSHRAVNFFSFIHEASNNWALTPCFVAEVAKIPALTEEVSEIKLFQKNNIPDDIAWWKPEDLEELMRN